MYFAQVKTESAPVDPHKASSHPPDSIQTEARLNDSTRAQSDVLYRTSVSPRLHLGSQDAYVTSLGFT